MLEGQKRKAGRPKGAKDKKKRRSKLFPGIEPIEPPKKEGRPIGKYSSNKFRAPIIERIVSELEKGASSLEIAAAGSGVSPAQARRLFRRGQEEYLKRENGEILNPELDYHVKFFEVCALGEFRGLHKLSTKLLEIAMGESEDLRANPRWISWILERRYPQFFGKSVKVEQEAQVTVKMTIAEIIAKSYGYNPPDSKGNFIRGTRGKSIPDQIPE